MKNCLPFCSFLIILLMTLTQCSSLVSRRKREEKQSESIMKDWKSPREDSNQTIYESSGKETSSEIGFDIKLFVSRLDEHMKTVRTLTQMLEEILKLFRNWIAINDKDSEIEKTEDNETTTVIQTTKLPKQTDNNETLQVEETTDKSLKNQSNNVKVYTFNEFKLTVINKDPDFSQEIQQTIFETFQEVYPKIRERFNKEATKNVTLIIDPKCNGTAETLNETMKINSTYFKQNPLDTDTITHELMHVVQSSYRSFDPRWLIEGLADYARWKYGRDIHPEKLTNFESKHNYTDSYKVTARFLVWLEAKVNNKVIDGLNKGLQEDRYQNGQLWNELTQKSVDDLWNEYTKHSGQFL